MGEKEKYLRIEVWFKGDFFRAFPNVIPETVKIDEENILTFIFGEDPEGNPHRATVNLNNVYFTETWEKFIK